MKPSVYRHAVLVAFSLGLLVLPMGCYQVSVSFEPTELDTSSAPPAQTPQFQSAESSSVSTTVSSPAPTVSNQVENSTRATNPVRTVNYSSGKTAYPGTLRMSNQTDQPVRLALLARRSLAKGSESSGQTQHQVPAHWDFAPKEGNEKGLILSLPNSNLKLSKGDILVAFAQDGSRRYWGPYIVGETDTPNWNPQKGEWQLVLSP